MIKKIAVFSAYTLPYLGGIERYINNLFQQLDKKGISVISVSTDFSFKGTLYEEKDGIYFFRLPIYKIFSSRYPIIKRNQEYKKIMKKLDEERIEAVIVNTRFHLTSLVGARFAKKNNIPVFLIEHGSQHLTVDNKILDFMGRLYEHALTCIVERYVDYNYGVSQAAVDWQKHFGIVSDGIWSNSINEFEFEKDKKHKGINITYAGRLIAQKGVEDLVLVFNELSKEYEDINLFIAGEGNQKDRLENLVNNERITFLGKLDFNDLKRIYEITDIFVYAPTWPEGLPTAILEAGLVGCAVIGSPNGGIKEVIENNKTGLMVNNKDELLHALKKLICNREFREELGKALSEKIKKKYTWNTTVANIIEDINRYEY